MARLAPITPSSVVRFEAFEVDLRAGELRRNGKKIKLQQQPFRVLALLLERPAEVVTREELRQAIWPGTFVEFNEGLDAAIYKLRSALGDSAEEPRFVETLPRRGYRFIGDVVGVVTSTGQRDAPPLDQRVVKRGLPGSSRGVMLYTTTNAPCTRRAREMERIAFRRSFMPLDRRCNSKRLSTGPLPARAVRNRT